MIMPFLRGTCPDLGRECEFAGVGSLRSRPATTVGQLTSQLLPDIESTLAVIEPPVPTDLDPLEYLRYDLFHEYRLRTATGA